MINIIMLAVYEEITLDNLNPEHNNEMHQVKLRSCYYKNLIIFITILAVH